MCIRGLTNDLGELLEIVIGHARSCATPQFLTQRLHGGLNSVIDIGITDETAEFVVSFREHAT